jgi:peptidoglycan hydrolase-like protein with peptidoglycan-binding domain
VAVTCLAVLLAAGCGDDDADPVAAARDRVQEAEDELAEAQEAFDDASDAFCEEGADYVEAVDRYGRVFGDDEATVGDVTTAGEDLTDPREDAQDSADEVLEAHERVVEAEQELAEAEAALAEAEGSPAPEPPTTSTTSLPTASVERVEQAEEDLASAFEGVADSTPLSDAAEEVNAAAYAVEVASLRLLADAGCLTEDEEAEAVAAVASYTATVQTSLTAAGYFEGEVDGVYGPATVAAVERLQEDNDLPVTGLVDRATANALEDAVADAEGADADEAIAHTAALQTILELAGYWTGPIDGSWTPALTSALQELQTDLGVPPTGVVDAATLEAFQRAVAEVRDGGSDEDEEDDEDQVNGSTTTTTKGSTG